MPSFLVHADVQIPAVCNVNRSEVNGPALTKETVEAPPELWSSAAHRFSAFNSPSISNSAAVSLVEASISTLSVPRQVS